MRGGGESFWHLQPRSGRKHVLASMSTARTARQVTDNIDHARLDADLFDLLQDALAVDTLSAVLAETWFDRGLQDLDAVVGRTRQINRYERLLRSSGAPALIAAEAAPSYVRDPAFRRVVTEIYDFRCAATGLRLVLPDGAAMVEAAHIHPFSEAGDDDPRNGLALTPDMHWALDRHLIAPDRRASGHRRHHRHGHRHPLGHHPGDGGRRHRLRHGRRAAVAHCQRYR